MNKQVRRPKLFISHASEDQDEFVSPVHSTKLLAALYNRDAFGNMVARVGSPRSADVAEFLVWLVFKLRPL